MKKMLAVVLMLVLGIACAAESDTLLDMVQDRGLQVDVADNPGGSVRCDFIHAGNGPANVTWSDAAHVYTVSGDSGTLSQLYLKALTLGGWESCRYQTNDAQLSFGAASQQRCATLEEYAAKVAFAMRLHFMASLLSGAWKNYVLNKRTMKFHDPNCSAVRMMSDRNREDYTGSRIELIDMGYSPCGICKP